MKIPTLLIISSIAALGVGPQPPSVSSVVNAASFLPTLCPGVIATINGSDFGSTTSDVTVAVGGLSAAVLSVAPSQIEVQFPNTVPFGLVPLTVTVLGQTSAPNTVFVQGYAPAMFTATNNGIGLGVFGTEPGALPISPTNSVNVHTGNHVTVYAVGLGPTNPSVPAGTAASGPTPCINPPQVTLAGQFLTVSYAGLAQGMVGVYRIDFELPNGNPFYNVGDFPLLIFTGGMVSPQVMLPVGSGIPLVAVRDISGAAWVLPFAGLYYGSGSLGGVFASDISSASDIYGFTFIVARDNSNNIWTNRGIYGFSGWEPGGGETQGTPAIAVDSSGTAWIASRDASNAYWLLSYSVSGGYGAWIPLGGQFSDDPAVTACTDGSIYVVGKDNSNALWSGRYVPGTGFQSFANLGGALQGNPSVTCGSDNAIYVAARDNLNSIWIARVTGTTLTGWFNGDHTSGIDPQITALGGSLGVVILDADGMAWRGNFAEGTGNGWQPWAKVGGPLAEISVAAENGQLSFAARTPGGDLTAWQFGFFSYPVSSPYLVGKLSASPR